MAFEIKLALPTRNVFTCLSTDVKNTTEVVPTDICFETDTKTTFEFNGVEWIAIRLKSSDGSDSTQVVVKDVGPITAPKNRQRIALATTYAEVTNTLTWSVDQNIHEVSILITAIDSAAVPPASTENYALVTGNAFNEDEAGIFLTEHSAAADGIDQDVQFDKFLIGVEYIYTSRTPIIRLDFLPVNVSTTQSVFHLVARAH